MAKALVIVESPMKAKTITKYLGSDYVVKSSFGHIRDLPIKCSGQQKNRELLIRKDNEQSKKNGYSLFITTMGINPWDNWQAHYKVLSTKVKVVNELKKIAEKVNLIYLATDLDREGEAIAWHLREVIGGNNNRYARVTFNEITENAICQAFKKPKILNIDRVNAQQARRFMDRVVGYMLSPLLWKKIARGLSAGRVQSVAVRLIVERERKIKTFNVEEFWKINVRLITRNSNTVLFQVTHKNNKPFHLKNHEQTINTINILKKTKYYVHKTESILTSNQSYAPFITSTLQQAASTKLGFSVKKTMAIAQKLYETGYITYMRTDSTNLSQDAINMVRSYIVKEFGNKYLPKNSIQYFNKKNSQEAHEAIRPSDVFIQSKDLKDMGSDIQKLYQLIWRQFVACQMVATKHELTTLIVSAGDFRLIARGYVVVFDGWTKIMPAMFKEHKINILPKVEKGDEFSLETIIPVQHFTKPPSRFSEASLVKELEKRAIGRPSTYESIISTIQSRGYVQVINHRFYAKKMGELVTDRLEKSFHDLINYNFTAQMEVLLDKIANRQAEWKKVLDDFFSKFTKQLKQAEKDPKEGGMQPNRAIITDINCPICNRTMEIRIAATGIFLSCSSYLLPPKERCRTTVNLVPENEILNTIKKEDNEINDLSPIKRFCKKCSNIMDTYFINAKNKLYICSNSPNCDNYEKQDEEFKLKCYYDKEQLNKCKQCNSKMLSKLGPFGKYLSCINNKCKNIRKILHTGKFELQKETPIPLPELLCTKSNSYFVLRRGNNGSIFLAANNFPKSRETRAPLVEELYRFRDRLPEKLLYLANAPQHDTEGNKTVVRFNRKTNQQYVVAEKNGKVTGWSASFIDGKWIINKKIKTDYSST